MSRSRCCAVVAGAGILAIQGVAVVQGELPIHTRLCSTSCLSADCNGNGIDDRCDISCSNDGNYCEGGACANDFCYRAACNVSSDCNGDGVPDECQLAGNDCNGNAVPDDCEGSTEACCTGTGICSEEYTFCCDGLGGVSAGPGSSCASGVCGDEGLACCKADLPDPPAAAGGAGGDPPPFPLFCDNLSLFDCVYYGGAPLSTTNGCSYLLNQPNADLDGDDVIDDACDNCSPADPSHNCDFFDCSNADQADTLICDGGYYDGSVDACINPWACENFGGGTCRYDGVGDVCDNCPNDLNDDQADDDADHVGNVCDNCPLISNPGQEDCNTNGIGDACDINDGTSRDCDANGIPDECDIANGDLLDCDGDVHADICDPDIDEDGVLNDADKCDYSPSTLVVDTTGLFTGTVRADLDGDCDVDGDDWIIFNASYQDGTGDPTCSPGSNEEPLCPTCPGCNTCCNTPVFD